MVSTVHRVPEHTSSDVNARIRDETDARVKGLAGNILGIDTRLSQLDREWDIERLLETNASSIAFSGILLGAFVDKRWLILPAVVTGFLFQHAVQGWCPPLPILRRLGFRTSREIEIERNALKALRGDYGAGPGGLSPEEWATQALIAARA